MTITKEEFQSYVKVQMSGVTNMWAVDVVESLSGLDREQILYIMKHYEELEKKYQLDKEVKNENV